MNKTKFTFNIGLGIAVGFLILGVLRWIGIDISLANVWINLFGEPNGLSITIVSLITILVVYFIVRGLYKKSVKSE